MTPTLSISAGTGQPQRYLELHVRSNVYLSWGWSQDFIHLVVVTSCSSRCPVRRSLSDCVPEGELSWPVLLQPGGAACSALLQPWPHTPQSQKQLYFPAQRCSSTYQVSLCHSCTHYTQTESTAPCVLGNTKTGGANRWRAVFSSLFFSLLDVERPSMTLTVFGATICFRKEAAWIKLQMTSEWEIVKFGWLKESHIGDERFDMQPPAVWDTGLFLVSQSRWSNLSNITVIWSSFFVSALSKYF